MTGTGESNVDVLSAEDFYELAVESGVSDGLPVLPPTRRRVDAMLESMRGAEVADPLGILPPLMGELTLERLAANAVMAGCLPEYFPVVVAAMRCVLDRGFNAAAVEPTTNPVGPMLLINGPVRERIGVNSGSGCMGPGWRANSTIGRAVRLACINTGGSAPGIVDRATQGYPGKLAFCFGENEEESPWPAFHVRRGFQAQDSVVTTYQACGFINVLETASSDPIDLIDSIAGSMRLPGSNNVYTGQGPIFLVLGPKHARILAGGGLSPADVQELLFERTRLRLADIPPQYRSFMRRRRQLSADEEYVAIGREPADIEISVAGGPGNHSVLLPGFAHGTAPSQLVVQAP